MIRVLVVDDSITQLDLMTHILESDPNIKVIATALDGKIAVQKVMALRPDIVMMDLNMPVMNGIEATRTIMNKCPVPIIIFSASSIPKEASEAFEAVEAGALAIFDKINLYHGREKQIIETVKLMSEIKVVRRYISNKKLTKEEKVKIISKLPIEIDLIAIGVSTGGPSVLQDIFKNLKKPYPPILVVQHITPDFLEGLIVWLKQTTGQDINIAEHGTLLKKNSIYFAPGGYQMGLTNSEEVFLKMVKDDSGHMPSVSFLFKSIAKIPKLKTIAIILTGMGKDGVDGLKLMKQTGALTIAQDEKSSVVYGMPGEAVMSGAIDLVLNPVAIAEYINRINNES